MRRFAFVLMLLVGSTAFGQAPVVPPVKPSPSVSVKLPDGPLLAGSLIKIDASASVGDSLDWDLISLDDESALDVHEDGRHATFAYPVAGTYIIRVEAESVINGTIVRAKQRIPVVLDASLPPIPPPVPNPTPTPAPPPAPSPSPSPSAYLVVIADATDPTLALVLTGATLSTLKAAQRGKIYAPTDEQLAAKGYDRAMAVKNVTAPCALLLDFRTGKVLSAFALPTTDAALAAELSKPHFR